ncbi:MAG TPA: hypothetical protein ENN50_05230, partial [Prosthecochloris aestuarii]|nr:hypothetical protein [Prosthecochloris aestuarii]
MGFLQQNARRAIERLIVNLAGKNGLLTTTREDCMDNGDVIRVTITADASVPEHPLIRIDFTGTAGESSGNINAPLAITRAAVLYCLRCLVDEPVALNAGCLEPVSIIIPEGSLLNPS